MDPKVHRRFLDYKDLYEYFGVGKVHEKPPAFSLEDFAALDGEYVALFHKGEENRDDEEQARFQELSSLLLRD